MFVMKQTELKFTCSHMFEIFCCRLVWLQKIAIYLYKEFDDPAAATEARRLRRIEAKGAVDVMFGCEWQKR